MKKHNRLKPITIKLTILTIITFCPVTVCAGNVAQYLIDRRYSYIEPGDLWENIFLSRPYDARGRHNPQTREHIISRWSEFTLPDMPEKQELKIRPLRQVLARLITGRDIGTANEFLRQMYVWNASGSEWDVRELWGWQKCISDSIRIGHRGDYDFFQTILISILYRFEDRPDLLYPETIEHIVENLLIDRGGPRPYVPYSLRLVPETENHLLMTESARFLTNQWLKDKGAGEKQYDNKHNGLEDWLADLLEKILNGGFYEFNSIPYQGYAMQPLMNLEAYADSRRIAELSRKILDAELWRYALSNMQHRRSVPFRRQIRRAEDANMFRDPLTQIAVIWIEESIHDISSVLLKHLERSRFAIDAAAASYRPPENLISFMETKNRTQYLVRMGRGRIGSPEIYSAGPGYMLSGGGALPRKSHGIALRPIVLLMEDGVYERDKCFNIPVFNRRNANRTGVYHRFACGDAPVSIPVNLMPQAKEGSWCIYMPIPENNLFVAVYNNKDFGLLSVFPNYENSAGKLLESLSENNPEENIRRSFVFPDCGLRIEYEPGAPNDLWVIKSVNKTRLVREFSKWGRMELFGNSILDMPEE